MTRIAIVGANGQVGTEVCLRLRAAEGLEVVPVSRNVSGSAFLRLNGIACRHGRIADSNDARRLIGDCDVVVSFALSTTAIPRVDREVNREIVRGIIAGAKPGASIVLASTIMVYAPGMKFRLPDSYGLEKLAAEKLLGRLCRRSHHPLFVIRLGHVLGDLQSITRKICGEIRDGEVALARRVLCGSNTIFTASIVEAIVQIARGAQQPGTYDLVTSPQWTWHDVYQHYASQVGAQLTLADANNIRDEPTANSSQGLLRRSLQYLRRSQSLRERLMFLLAYLPTELNQRIYLRYLQTRAIGEIEALRQSQKIDLSVPDWRELKINPMPGLADPMTLESRYPLQCTFDFSGVSRAEQFAPHLPQ